MKSILVKTSVLALVVFASGTAWADNNFGVGVKAGTLGIGLEGTWRPLPYMDLRVGGNAYDYKETGNQAGVNYEHTLGLESYYATANFRFPLSPFRVTAGLYSNGNELRLESAETGDFDIGGVTFTQAEIGTLSSTTSFANTAPYVGFGYDFSLAGKVGLNLDFGVLWQGEPSVTMTTNGLLANDPTLQFALETERLEIEDEFKDYKAWPVLSLGVVFNF
jgi:hypothetical protein